MCVAASSVARMSSRSARRRRGARPSARTARGRPRRGSRRSGAKRPRTATASCRNGQHRHRAVAEGHQRRAAARAGASSRGPSSRPKTARRMISRVKACRGAWSADRLVRRPGVELALGQLVDEAGQALHAVAVEGGQQQLALLHVRSLVEQDHRVAADDRLEQACALAGVQDVRRRGEDGLRVLGIGEDHERRLTEQTRGEARAVLPAKALEAGDRSRPEADGLQRSGNARSRRECRVSHPVGDPATGHRRCETSVTPCRRRHGRASRGRTS